MIKKALKSTLQELQALNGPLWVQVGGMSTSISFGMLLFSLHNELHSKWGWVLMICIELLLILFSVSTFSIYLAKKGITSADKVGLRKVLGASGWELFLEISARTTLLIVIAIVLSIALIDTTTLMVGLRFENILFHIGVLQFASLLLAVFLISEGVLFMIIGIALAPEIKINIKETTSFEEDRFRKITKSLSGISLILALIIAVLAIFLTVLYVELIAIKILISVFFALSIGWYYFNKSRNY